MTDRIVYRNSELFYYKEGTGTKTILLFHGFGHDHRAFEPWSEVLQKEYTAYSFDLFFHGNSKWENQQALKKDDWKKIMQLFFDQEKIERFEIVGFSMGARFALTTVALFPERIQKIILLAPDGVNVNFWYRLATSSSLMRSLFRALILSPNSLKVILKLLRLFRLDDKNVLRFAEAQLNTTGKRQRVYQSWIYFRHLHFNLSDLSRLLNTKNIPIIFIVGKLDKVIVAEKIKTFAKGLEREQFHLLDAGHHDLIEKAISIVKPK